MKKLITTSLLTLIGLSQLIGQDFHFSQFYANPQLLNPALTGNFKEDYRVNLIHRNQWSGIGSKFQTTAFGGDINLQGGKLNKDKIGIGAQVYLDDQASILKTQGFLLSGSYIHTLGGHRRHRVGGGLQFGYMRKSINTDDLQFGNQYQNHQYNTNLSSNEAFESPKLGSMTVQAGLTYDFEITKETHLFSGLSTFQINSPKQSISGTESKLGRRYVFNVGVKHQLTEKIIIIPQLMYVNQSRAKDLNLGGLVKYELIPSSQTNVVFGAFYRTSDAFILVGGADYKGFKAKLSYDVTTSGLRKSKKYEGAAPNNIAGAWEVSLIFKGLFKNHNYANDYTVPCGIF